ncbi:MAG: serine hydrolase [Candidatus Aminicenantales bacterium]
MNFIVNFWPEFILEKGLSGNRLSTESRKKFSFCFLFIPFLFLPVFLLPGYTFSFPSNSDSLPDYQKIIDSYEQYVQQQMARDRVPGLSVAFRHHDFYWAKGFGWADLENEVPATAASSYRLASITKTMTAVAILLLYEEGKIDLDAEVQEYVPLFPRKPWPITIRQLLGHLGGISHYRNYDVEGHIREPKTTSEALAIFQNFPLVAEPGSRYNYSTYGYNLLGAVVEAVSGIPYGEFIRRRIALPLGMQATRLDSPTDLIFGRVRGYRLVADDLRRSEFIDTSSRFAGGGLRSTVEDLVKYAYGLIIEGKILRPETRKMMLTSQVQKNGLFTNYGMGWVVDPWNGHFHVNHGGSQQETRTHLAVFPEEGLVIAVACNLEGTNLSPYVQGLAERIFGERMGTEAYPTSVDAAIIWRGCVQAFNYGLSYFSRNKSPLAASASEIKANFSTFNQHLNPRLLSRQRSSAWNFVLRGVHPAGGQVLTKIGSFMAQALAKYGDKPLSFYHQHGPAAFFHDYIELRGMESATKQLPRFDREIQQVINKWAEDWPHTFTPQWLDIDLAPGINWETVTNQLKAAFAGRLIYPDLSAGYLQAAQQALNKQKIDEALRLVNLGLEVYPLSPSLYAALGIAYFWHGNIPQGKKAFEQAFSLNPNHQAVSVDRFLSWSSQMQQAKKTTEALSLLAVALLHYPREARLYLNYGRLNLQAGDREKALASIEKALTLDPNMEEARELVEKIRKK